MFSNLKNKIRDLARKAVSIAEAELGSGKGQEKKKLAIEYIVRRLPFPPIVKTVFSILMSGFIDDVVEMSVEYMKTLPDKEGE